MRFGYSKFTHVIACAAFLAAASACGSAFAAKPAVSCELPEMNTADRPNMGSGATKVAVGIFLIDITRIDDVNQQFTLDFVVFQTWKDPRLKGFDGCRFDLAQVWSPVFEFLNSGRVFPSLQPYARVGPEGTVTYPRRYRGSLSFPHGLHNFPFDKHTIRIAMIPPDQSGQKYELVANQKTTGRQENLTVLDWTLGAAVSRVSQTTHPVSGKTIDLFNFEISAKRRYHYYLWKVLLPLLLIVAMSWSVFWINPAKFGPQIGMSATSMLTLIAFQFAMAGILPRLSYFTLLDGFITASTILVFGALLESLTTAYFVSVDRMAMALRLDRTCRWAFPLAFLVIVVAIFIT